ncbi:MAG: aminotransferase class V-fold PLP-dependent enzyme [Pseudomonadota bacterium]
MAEGQGGEGAKTPGFETRQVHAGTNADPATGARAAPIYQTSSYVFQSPEHAANLFALKEAGYIYSRLTNPTIAALQERLAALDGGVGAVATASGHAAQLLSFFSFMEPGAEIVAADKLYGGTISQLKNSFPRAFGWHTHMVDADDPSAFEAAIGPKTKAVFIESLANPGGVVTDIAAIAAIAHKAGLPLIVDNTMATPALCRPIEHGADLVVYSTTKFLSGNGTSIGGAVVDAGTFDWTSSEKFSALHGPAPEYHGLSFTDTFGPAAFTMYGHGVGLRDLGVNQQPLNAWLTLLGLETLSLRMERHCANALAVARHLEGHSAVEAVNYAGLPSSPYHRLAEKYLPSGAGAVFTFSLKGGYDAGVAAVKNVKLFSHLANIGDSKSLIIHPASTTHSQLSAEQQAAAGAGPDIVRLSIGIESVDDLIDDLDQALGA